MIIFNERSLEGNLMKQSPSSKRGRSLRSVESLIRLAEGLATSGSRAEDVYWNKKLEAEIKKSDSRKG